MAYPAQVLARPVPRLMALLLALLGGYVTDLAFPDAGVWPLSIVGLGLLFVALGRNAPWWNAFLGFVWGTVFFLLHLQWAQFAVGKVPWIGLSVLEALFVATVAFVWTWVRRVPHIRSSRALQAVSFAVLWVAGELARSVAPFGGFPWGRLAFSQSESPLGRLAWLGGAPLVSLVVAAAAALLAGAVLAALRVDLWHAGAGALACAVLIGLGLTVPLDTQAEEGTLAVGAVQGNLAGAGLDAFNTRREVLNNHVNGTYALLNKVAPGELDLIVWPENGTDFDPQVDQGAAAAIDGAATALNAPILLGAQEFPDGGGRYNVSLLWQPGVGVVARYAKQHPAPFAEYMPWRSVFRPFSSAVDLITTDMLAGDQVGVVPLESPRLGRTVLIGDVICFEVVYDSLVSESVSAGAELIVVQTNNASFGPTNESTQQLAMSRLRAIETGRTTIQISTVGVSAVITPNGVAMSRTGLFTTEQMVDQVPLRSSITPAVRLAPWTPWITLAMAVFLLSTAVMTAHTQRAARREKRRTSAKS